MDRQFGSAAELLIPFKDSYSSGIKEIILGNWQIQEDTVEYGWGSGCNTPKYSTLPFKERAKVGSSHWPPVLLPWSRP